jgi:hypothetical protein
MIPCAKKLAIFPSLNSLYGELYIIDICFSDFNFYVLANVLLRVGILHGCTGAFLRKEGGIQVLVGLAPSSQTVENLTPGIGKIQWTIAQLEK